MEFKSVFNEMDAKMLTRIREIINHRINNFPGGPVVNAARCVELLSFVIAVFVFENYPENTHDQILKMIEELSLLDTNFLNENRLLIEENSIDEKQSH